MKPNINFFNPRISLKKPSKSILITGANNIKKIENLESSNINESSKDHSFYKTRNHSRQFSVETNLKIKLNPFKTQSNIYSSLSQKKYFSPEHSIFNRFKNEFKKNFKKSINDTKEKFSKSIYKYKPELFPKIAARERKKHLEIIELRKKNPFQIIKTYRFLEEENKSEDEKMNLYYENSESEKNIKSITLINLGLRGIEYKFNSYLENDLIFQSNIIKDELSIILDNIQYYKSICLSSENIISSFKNKDLNFQINTNKMLEETNALLNLIPKIILKEYYEHTEKFIAVEQPSFDDFKPNFIKDESECFITNAKLLNKIAKFLKCCFDVYLDLISQIEENMIIKRKDFNLLLALFEKVRFLIGELTFSAKNAIKDLEFDRKLINKYKPLIMENSKEKKINDSKGRNLSNSNEKIIIKKNKSKSLSKEKINIKYLNHNLDRIDIGEKMTQDLQFKKNEENLKIQRIKNSLNAFKKEKNPNEVLKEKQSLIMIKEKPGPMNLINSDLMTKMLKYLKKDVRGKIISLRTVERFHENSKK